MPEAAGGTVYYSFVARAGKMLSELRSAGKSLNRHERLHKALKKAYRETTTAAVGYVRSLTSMRTAVVALAGTGGLGALVRSSISSASALKENAQQAGIGVRQFQELTFAASHYAVSQDALIDAIKELNLRVDEFVETGVGPAQEALERLGFTNQELVDGLQDSDRLFSDVIARMQDLDTAAQIRIADELFGGTGGEQMVRMIQGGADALERLRQEAHSLGLVFDDEQIAQAEKMRQEMSVIEFIFGTQIKKSIIDNAAPLSEFLEKLRELIPTIIRIGEEMTKAFGYLVENARTIITVSVAARGALAGGSAGATLGRFFGPKGRALGGLLGAGIGGTAGYFGVDEIMDRMNAATSGYRRRPLPPMGGLSTTPIQEQIKKAVPVVAPPAPLVPARPVVPLVLEQTEELAKVKQNILDLTDQETQLLDKQLEMYKRLEAAGDDIAWALGRSLDRVAGGIESIGDSLKSLVSDVAAALRRNLIIQPLVQNISGLFSTFATGQTFGQGFRGLQHGGVHRGPAIVGEAGPELVNLGSTSRVFPADETRKMLGGINVNYSPVFNGASGEMEGMQSQGLPAFINLIREVIREEMRG